MDKKLNSIVNLHFLCFCPPLTAQFIINGIRFINLILLIPLRMNYNVSSYYGYNY